MKSRVGVVLGLASVLCVVLGWRVAARQEEKATRFSIIVTATATGAALQCELGCNWKELSFGCDSETPCTARVDEHGVGGAGDSAVR